MDIYKFIGDCYYRLEGSKINLNAMKMTFRHWLQQYNGLNESDCSPLEQMLPEEFPLVVRKDGQYVLNLTVKPKETLEYIKSRLEDLNEKIKNKTKEDKELAELILNQIEEIKLQRCCCDRATCSRCSELGTKASIITNIWNRYQL